MAKLLDMKLDAAANLGHGLRLEPLGEAHRSRLAASGAIDAMWSWMPVIAAGTSFDSYFDYTLAEAAEGRTVPFAVIGPGERLCGVAAYLEVMRTHRRLQIGYQWHPEDLRGGIVPAATSYGLIARARDLRFRRIEFLLHEANIPALKAIERLGVRREGLLRDYQRAANGEWANMVLLSLIDREIDVALSRLSDRIAKLNAA